MIFGLVILVLVDQLVGNKKKDKFVLYRDLVLIWLLKVGIFVLQINMYKIYFIVIFNYMYVFYEENDYLNKVY